MKFKRKVWKTGNAHVVTIPKTYIEDGYVQEGDEVTIEVSPDPGDN